jgi:hypothetical protein
MRIPDQDHVERQRQARDRVERQTRQLRWSRWADSRLPMAEYYATWGWPHGRYCTLIEDRRPA